MKLLRGPVLLVALCLTFSVGPARADDFTSQQPSYTRMASQCGEDPSRPSFSASEYAAAMVDAAKAIKDAKRQGNRDRQNAIQNSVARLKECKDEETRKFTVPRIRNCREFINAYNAFSVRAANLLSTGKITTADRDRVRENFRAPAESCVREMMTKCIDPTKTSDVDFVIDAMQAASDFGFIFSYRQQSGMERLLTVTNPGFLRMTFCTDTDYSCRGDQAACNNRINRIKLIMETYIRK